MRLRQLPATVLLLTLAACGGSDSGNDPTGPGGGGTNFTYSLSVTGGSNQEVRTEEAAAPISVRLVRSDGAAVPNESLVVQVASGGGTLSTSTVTTSSSGTAQITGWAVGPQPGPNRLRIASASLGASTEVEVTARYPRWTVMVYMAADNNLARPGLMDLEEIESATLDPDVQVVMQAEFSPTYLGLEGCDASCLNRPNFNTVRYVVGSGTGNPRLGFDGPTQDIGNVDMTDPGVLSQFISWTQSVAPAERYLLIPWNHGGGYQALIEDATSAGNEFMTMDEFASALGTVPTIDIVDFDMCSMAAYETLLSLRSKVDYAVFSQELVPGDGLPYRDVITRLQSLASSSTESVAGALVDVYHTAYTGSRTSTTKSAYRVEGVAELDEALSDLAIALQPQLSARRTQLQAVLAASQKYTPPEQTDIVTFASLLEQSGVDASIQQTLVAVRAAAQAPDFRIANRFRNGDLSFDPDVSRSTGLHFVFPSGLPGDQFASAGRRSVAYYRSSYPTSGWSDLLQAWDGVLTREAVVDLGLPNRLELYLAWDPAAAQAGADVDLVLLEPDGSIYIPWIGRITRNGRLTADSEVSDNSYEGFISNRFVEGGTYYWYAWLYTDPANTSPSSEVFFRFQQAQQFTPLYDGNGNPVLTLASRWEDDPGFTFGKANGGAYSNFQLVSTWDPVGGATSGLAPPMEDGPDAAAPMVEPTDAQLETLKRLMEARKEGGR